ncbi:MAG: V-type ATPase subunit [Coriobacteriia bacterium]|nr:V-type ATPase subunit [Coriobacteriia bacterium]
MRTIRPIADPRRYGFAVGRVRVLETRLLSRATFERLLDAAGFADQRRILSETPYGGYLETADTPEDIERALDRTLADLYADFLEQANLPEPIVLYFRTGHDFENLRGRIKAEALGIPADDLVVGLGSVPREAFLSPEATLPEHMAEAERRIRAAIADEDDNLDPDLVDAAVDAEMYAALTKIAGDSRSEFLRDLAGFGVDTANVRAFVRARAKGLSAAEAERMFVSGGNVERGWYVASYRLPLEEAADRIVRMQGFRGSDPGAMTDVSRIDIAVARLMAARVHAAGMVAVGPEPVVAYVLARRAEIETLRVLLIGKMAGASKGVLRARLKDVA